ncbi:hypothetical protein Pla22_42110 [Rubripirellula amarantea]|uniref:Secreted protein n=1 Tax=Rubripirellula amarantea TaxID=2527999 RepID=A0A5C5WN58_9BACT|nr:hypothetical protein Pla22_42110 [Rubripirellula amarantea]
MSSIAKKIVPVFALAALFTFALGGEAQAQHGFHHGSHHGGVHHGGGFHHGGIHNGGGHHVYPQPHVPSYPSYPTPGFGHQYHDTTHLDYHAPSLQRHGNHFHYQPGHYDVHQTGHWH